MSALTFHGRRDTNPTRIINRQPNHPLIVSPQTLPILVNRIYTDVDGAVIDKSLAPAGLQVSFPVFVLGQYDRQGGYKISRQLRAPLGTAQYLFTFVVGTVLPFPYATGLNTVNARLTPGDLVQVYTDDIDAPNYYVFIVQSIKANISGLGSVLFDTVNNTQKKNAVCRMLDLYANTGGTIYDAQFNEPLRFISFNESGTFKQDDINPLSYKQPIQYQNGFIKVPVEFPVNEKFGLATYMQYGTDQMQFVFNIR